MASVVAFADDVASLWIQPFSGAAHRVEGAVNVQRPFWSPDGKSVAYFAVGGLFRVDAAGGAPVLIAKRDTEFPNCGAWLDGGTILFTDGWRLFAVPAAGGEPKLLLEADYGFPQALPGGAFLYLKGEEEDTKWAVYAATLANPTGKRLVGAGAGGLVGYASGYLLWANGTSLFAQPFDPRTLTLSGEPKELLKPIASGTFDEPGATVSTTGRLIYDAEGSDRQLAWYARTGQRLGPVGGPGSFQGFRLLDNGRRVLVQANARQDEGLWLIDERGLSSRIASDNIFANPTPSADGKSVIFSIPGAGFFRSDISGENRVTIKTSDEMDFRFPTDWSGDVLLFTVASPMTKADLWSVRVTPDGRRAPGAEPMAYLQTPAYENNARFAPGQNQKWLAYQSDESGRQEVYVQSFPVKGEKLRMSNQGGTFPVWGPGGRELFYVSPDSKIMVADVKFGPSSVSASTARELFPIPLSNVPLTSSPFDTVDGQRFLVLAPVAPASHPLQVVDNWTELLKH